MNQLPDDDLLALLMADEAGSEQSIQRATESGPSELSFAQQRLWFLQQLAPQSSAYNLPRAIQLRGALDATVLQVALQHIIDKHDILKTAFLEIDGQPRQVVVPEARLRLALEDLSTLEPTQRRQPLRTRLDAEAGRAFDLSQAPLIRGALLKMAPDEHVLLLNMHHIVSDAWSNPILMQDLGAAYELAGRDAPGRLARPAIQYHDYARWQRRDYPRTPRHDAAAAYWKTYLGEEILPLELPADFLVAPDTRHPAASHSLSLAPELSRNLNAFCQAHGLTPFVVLLGAWQLLLGRYSNQQDFTVGVPNATRNQSETQDLVGFFVSSLIYRAQLDHSLTTLDFLQRLRQESLAALEHSDYPVELIIEDLHVQRRTQANPLFQTLFNWRVAGQQQGPMALGELQLEFLPLEQQEAKFDLALEVEYQPQAIHASLEYSSALFRPQTIERMAQHWQNLLHAIVADASQRIGDLALLDSGEQQASIDAWNPARVEFPATQGIHHLIEQQVERTPEAVAVVFHQQSLSYRQLNQRANRLAHQLIEHGVGPDVLVGLAVERSLEMVIGLLAILKAGGAYV
ncbi:condensation domain-containing protein, partial [Pseudomonas sp. CF161]|uniref:condensation domain-containing protein n=1 Tax=Pseudomonas sp. CF161 TaxID=911241 RepID=UPI00035504CA